MRLSLNELSLDGQFHDIDQFRHSLSNLMTMRQRAISYGFPIFCHRTVANARVTRSMILQQAVQFLSAEIRIQLLLWLQQRGPFWEENQSHSPDDIFEINGEILIESAIAEAADHRRNGVDSRLVSFTPSSWDYSPVEINFHPVASPQVVISVPNYFDLAGLEAALHAEPNCIESWSDLENRCRERFTRLTFSTSAFAPLGKIPFVVSASERTVILLSILDRIKACFDERGERTPEGHELFENYFMGDKARFSDSSDDEKEQISEALNLSESSERRRRDFLPHAWKDSDSPVAHPFFITNNSGAAAYSSLHWSEINKEIVYSNRDQPKGFPPLLTPRVRMQDAIGLTRCRILRRIFRSV